MKKCPQCYNSLKYSALDGTYACERSVCGYFITEEAMDRTLKQFYGKSERLRSYEDNLSELNNLGHRVRSEDYSDKN